VQQDKFLKLRFTQFRWNHLPAWVTRHSMRPVGSPTASRQQGPRRTVRASFPAYSSSTALSVMLTPVEPASHSTFANVTSLTHLIAEAKGAEPK
jgi:hypothetical protein